MLGHAVNSLLLVVVGTAHSSTVVIVAQEVTARPEDSIANKGSFFLLRSILFDEVLASSS
jgi:hypothetical protein